MQIPTILSLAALLLTTSATPIPTYPGVKWPETKPVPTLPSTTAGTAQLPPISPGLVLKHITLGRGTQNYSCASAGATPVAIGAVATLFDITPLAVESPSSPLLTLLPAIAVTQPLPKGDAVNHIKYPGTDHLVVIGKHFFDSTGAPIFDLYSTKEKLVAKKLADVDAPNTASAGPAGTGAVKWLKLDDKGGSVGLKEVYRVVTAGGNPTACMKTGVISVQYATEYWFYG